VRKFHLGDIVNSYRQRILSPLSKYKGFFLQARTKKKNPITPSHVVNEYTPPRGKIAVHLHLFYIDLLDELVNYCINIPYPFDLFITTTTESNYREIKSQISNLLNGSPVNLIEVIKVPNRGRDIAAFLGVFNTRFSEYDYLCHIHSKKSLHAGREWVEWRTYLVNSLLGNPHQVNRIFELFELNTDVGMIYPSSYSAVPYYTHSWLSNRQSGAYLGRRLGIIFDFERYAEFSPGSMFWARAQALKPLFEAEIKYVDFPQEPLPSDGTLAHAIERSLTFIAKKQGFTFIELDMETGGYSIGIGKKNLYQYWQKSISDIICAIKPFHSISFDVFETLVTKPLLHPDHFFILLEERVNREFNIEFDFFQIRKEADSILRQKIDRESDIKIDDIYIQFQKLSGLDKAAVDRIKEMETDFEVLLSLPRQCIIDDVLELVRITRKKVILLSDTYYTSNDIMKILEKQGIDTSGFLTCFSSETGKRKDNGEIWKIYRQSIGQLHVGDDEQSDMDLPLVIGIPCCHVMSPVRLFEHFNPVHSIPKTYSLADSIYLGPVIARLFSNPFRLHPDGQLTISDPKEFGYCVFGPILFYFTVWLFKQVNDLKIEKVLFLSGKGAFLKRIFDLFTEKFYGTKIETTYLFCSEPAVNILALERWSDIVELVEVIEYNGSFGNFLETQFGIQVNPDEQNRTMSSALYQLPSDKEALLQELAKYKDLIITNAFRDRDIYGRYLESINALTGNKIALVDIDYSNSIQTYLTRFANKPIHGLYIIKDEKDGLLSFSQNIYSCFNHFIVNCNESYIHKYSFLLESILLNQEGMFLHFMDDKGNLQPIFRELEKPFNWPLVSAIQEGIVEYITDSICWFGQSAFDNHPPTETVEYFFKLLCDNPSILGASLQNVLKTDGWPCKNH
jgi:predicted HAD superfamily hydrolase